MTLGIISRRRAKSRWLALGMIVVMASALAAAGSITLGSSTGQSISLNQCRNGGPTAHVQCIGSAFQSGNLGATNSHYREGDSVPFQAILTGMTTGTTHHLIINWAETASSKHAYDYIDTYTQSEKNPIADACFGVLTTLQCGVVTTASIPTDLTLTAPTCPFAINEATQTQGVVTFYNAEGVSVKYSAGNPSTCTGTANTGFADIAFTTTADQTSAVIAWGGHIASSIDWGANQSASAISGSPYHMAIGTLDGASTGSEDRSIKAAAILPVPTIVTSADSAAGTVPTVTSGGSFTDVATLTGDSTHGNVTGSVQFYICGPTNGVAPCTAGTLVGGTVNGGNVTLTVLATTIPSSTATSASVSETATGSYCFRVLYTPDATANYSPGQSTSPTNECVQVVTLNTSTTSTPQTSSTQLGTFANATSATIGAWIRDTAVVSDTSTPTGSIAFSVCGPTLTATSCTLGATPEAENTAARTSNSTSVTFYSVAFQPTTVGYYCFSAQFTGAGAFQNSSDSSTGECIDILKADTGTVTTPSGPATVGDTNVTDTAVVTGIAALGAPTGKISFFLCSPAQMTAASETTCAGTTGTADASNPLSLVHDVTDPNPYTSHQTSDAFTVNAAGTWCFRAVYAGDTNYNGSSDATKGECFTVGPASPSNLTAQSLIPDDSFTLIGGFNPTGHIDFYLFAPGVTCSVATEGSAAFSQPNVAVTGNGTYSTTNHSQTVPYVATTVGTYEWLAIYTSGDANNNNSSSTCTETFNITN